MDYTKITNVKVEGIDTKDYPDFCDAFIGSADYEGKPMNNEQLDELSEDSEFMYQSIQSQIY